MTLPYTISAGQDVNAAPLQGNFSNLDGRVAAIETVIDNIAVDAQLYGNGVFPGGFVASQVTTTLVYTAGTAVVNNQIYKKSSITVDFAGKASDTYYVEMDTNGDTEIYTTNSPTVRTNLNTVVWNGTGFDSVTTADRVELVGYSEVSDARDTEDSLDDRLDKIEDGTRRLNKITTQSTATLTLDDTHRNISCDTTSNSITITIPDASSHLGRVYLVSVDVEGSGNDVTLDRSGSDEFIWQGSSYTSIVLTLHDFVIIEALGNDKYLVKAAYGAVFS